MGCAHKHACFKLWPTQINTTLANIELKVLIIKVLIVA